MKNVYESILKNVYFQISCIMEICALVYFTAQGIYAVTGFIVIKWVIVLIYFGLDLLIATVKRP